MMDEVARERRAERRREAALAVRRRRLLVIDLAAGAAVALVLLALGLGLAPEGLIGLLVLVVVGCSFWVERRRGRRREESRVEGVGRAPQLDGHGREAR